jgi:DNA polymerase-3 subunit delta'
MLPLLPHWKGDGMAFLPEEAIRRLRSVLEQGRLAHAYLASAGDASVLESFAKDFARLVLDASEADPKSLPDFHEVRPESKSRKILVDQMRALEDALHQKPFVARRKVAIIYDADRMGNASANAFLKTLEEPPPETYILLLTRVPDALLPTISSRCVGIPLREAVRPAPSSREVRARNLALELLNANRPPTLAQIFLAVRGFQSLLSELRESISSSAASTLKAEIETYKDRTEGKWLEEREEQLNALVESELIRERAQLLQAIANVFAERLRANMADGDPRLARSDSLGLLRKLDAIERLREDLNRTMNEQLTLEAGFLEIFGES